MPQGLSNKSNSAQPHALGSGGANENREAICAGVSLAKTRESSSGLSRREEAEMQPQGISLTQGSGSILSKTCQQYLFSLKDTLA